MADDVYISFVADVNVPTVNQLLGICGQQVQAGVKRLHLMISSNGGNVHAGISAYNTLKAMPVELHTYNMGNVDSIATVIYLSGARRVATPRCSFLFHGVSYTFQNAQLHQTALEEHLEALRKDQKLIGDVIADRTRIDADEIRKMFLRAACVPPDEAVAKGISHDVTEVKVPDGVPFYQLVFN
jgi:ATP-dependent Clp protease protease subunit